MSETRPKAAPTATRDYSETLFLPQTDFPMRAGLPQREPLLLERWREIDLYRQLRERSAGRRRFVLHDGPPYANGNIHIGHALNKILKDLVTRSQQLLGFDSNYVPGWDCHGLPIEWKIEEQYRAAGRNKDEVGIVDFRRECRSFAQHWLDVQREEFKRLAVEGDWAHPYTTMAFPAEAQIAREIMHFARTGQLYRGSKPVMWSPVERTALAEAEVEYEERTSQTVWVAFPVAETLDGDLDGAKVVIWTTTPWTIPANRGISYGPDLSYGLYRITEAAADNWAKPNDRYILADKLAADTFAAARVTAFERVKDVLPVMIERCSHPFRGLPGADGFWDFDVPVLPADYVTDDAGTGFVHSAPGHGQEDYATFLAHREAYAACGTTEVPHTIDEDSAYLPAIPFFAGLRVFDAKGKEGGANAAVIAKLAESGGLVARGRLKHSYPHSWRSKGPLLFRNTAQWFIAMDRDLGDGSTLRSRALEQIHNHVTWVPAAGENRITGMIENRPDWVVSRQRAWGVPIAIFVQRGSDRILRDDRVDTAIAAAFEAEGADAWFAEGAAERFLAAGGHDPAEWEKVDDILDVWFDSGSTHAFTLEDPRHFPGLAGTRRTVNGGQDTVMYLEGSDQHRGWFHSSLLESCGTRGRAPFDVVLTHGFVLDERGEKMSKSRGNVTAPQDVIKASGADILRLWVAASDYSDDLRIGPEILKTFSETYRKLRNTLRWMLGTLAHGDGAPLPPLSELPEMERWVLHRLAELDREVRQAYAAFDYARVVSLLSQHMTGDLSAFYFDVRKDALYCDPISSPVRKAALAVIDEVFRRVTIMLAPILAFTAEEAWLGRYPSETGSVHLETLPEAPAAWQDDALAARWASVRRVRRVVLGALEIERAAKRIGASLEAAPTVYAAEPATAALLRSLDMAEICITSGFTVSEDDAPADAFRLEEVPGVAVRPGRAQGTKCARSWKITPEVGSDPDYPEVTPRDAAALREWDAVRRRAL
ncbi:isoleucine--tRNA ligase [Enterovirga sp.]|uniref:isoleucine--tRNA ligase n=1 Tax=Enterovirga sp. TaxID=2026350 RepID=UPI002610E6CC|nr:isoleucine--tRNA ligase [Enterovirga sp.]MDB5590990.1 isoleucine-tRNA ligase [Enterovirga sp.]